MLVEFSVENYKSIAEKQSFSMAAGSAKSQLKPHLFETGNSLAPKLMRTACVFGPNGSGKSSFIDAVNFFRTFIISSAKDSQEGEPIEVVPFAFSEIFSESPTEFEAVFIFKERLYQYGFSVCRDRVVDEWLFSKENKPRTSLKEIFQRNFDEESGEYVWEMPHLKGQKEVWKAATRDNALFLSTAIMLRSKPLAEPFEWLASQLRIVKSTDRLSDDFTVKQVSGGKKNEVLDILKAADLGISSLKITSMDEDHQPAENIVENLSKFISKLEGQIRESPLQNNIRLKLKGKSIDDLDKAEFTTIQAVHKSREGVDVSLDFGSESDGTRVIFSLAGPLLDVLENGRTLFVDELHNSLHPHALRFLVQMFLNPEINTKNAQLIFTSHETSIMAKHFLHRDQIWLMEKEDGATCLFPLSEFKGRDFEAFQRAYLDGRYGGVPRISEVCNGQS